MPHFFSASHTNYVCYELCYLQTMHKVPVNKVNIFMKGEHITSHQDGLLDEISSDMIIEDVYM